MATRAKARPIGVAVAEDDTFAISQLAPPKPRVKPAPVKLTPTNVGGISGGRLLGFIQRIEKLQEEIAGLRGDIREIRSEAKGTGFDVKIITHLIKIRKADKDDLDEFETMLDVYKRAIGMSA